MEQVEGGYEGHFDGLPNSELTFSIVQTSAGNVFLILFFIIAAFFAGGWIIVVGIIALIVVIILCIRKAKKRETQ